MGDVVLTDEQEWAVRGWVELAETLASETSLSDTKEMWNTDGSDPWSPVLTPPDWLRDEVDRRFVLSLSEQNRWPRR